MTNPYNVIVLLITMFIGIPIVALILFRNTKKAVAWNIQFENKNNIGNYFRSRISEIYKFGWIGLPIMLIYAYDRGAPYLGGYIIGGYILYWTGFMYMILYPIAYLIDRYGDKMGSSQSK